MADLLADPIVDIRPGDASATLRTGDGALLATVEESLTTSQKIRQDIYAFNNNQRGTRPLRHRLELRGPSGEPLYSVVKNREYPFTGVRICVLDPDGNLLGVATRPWWGGFSGSHFRFVGADREPLGELRGSALRRRYIALDHVGIEVAHFAVPTLPTKENPDGICRVGFDDHLSDRLRILVLGCAIVLRVVY